MLQVLSVSFHVFCGTKVILQLSVFRWYNMYLWYIIRMCIKVQLFRFRIGTKRFDVVSCTEIIGFTINAFYSLHEISPWNVWIAYNSSEGKNDKFDSFWLMVSKNKNNNTCILSLLSWRARLPHCISDVNRKMFRVMCIYIRATYLVLGTQRWYLIA